MVQGSRYENNSARGGDRTRLANGQVADIQAGAPYACFADF
jgi:hypothetical protein